jgi:tetratricopeptide (TPR) repeat protein
MASTTADTGLTYGSTLGGRVRDLRRERGLTQEQLAGDRCTKEYVSQIERGVARPTQATILWLAEQLDADAEYLATGVGVELELVLRAEELVERNEYAEACEVLAGASWPEVLEVRALLVEAWARMYLGELETALGLLDRAAQLAEDEATLADVLYRTACCEYKRSEVDRAQELYSQALVLAVRGGAPDRLRAHIHEWRSRCYRRRRDWAGAAEDVELALELAVADGDEVTQAHALFQASLVSERQGNAVSARRQAREALTIYRALGDLQNAARMLNNLGGIEHGLGHSDRAVELLQQAFATALEVGNEADAAQAVSSLARVQLDVGANEQAERNARHALELLGDRVDYLDEIGSAQIVLGRALLACGRLEEAESCFAEAEESFSALSSTSHCATAWTAQGDLALERGDDREARECFRRAALALHDVDLGAREVI